MTTEGSEITAIEKQKNRSRYNIYLNHEYAFSIHEDVLVKHRLLRGSWVDDEQLKAILQDEERNLAFQRAIKYISYRPKAVKEVERKLKELGFSDMVISSVLTELQAHRYLDDRDYAVSLTQYRLHKQKKGIRWIAHELREKGISNEHIEHALSAVDETSEYQAAFELAQKRLPKDGKLDQKVIQKISAYLHRRGFETSMVMRVVRQLSDNDKE